MTRLLVSVRDAEEAAIARRCGVDLVDVKEPSRGPLGAADFSVVGEVVREIAPARPVSMALGELLQWKPNLASQLPAGLDFVKWGMAGAAGGSEWPSIWRLAVGSLPTQTRPVAVVYADWKAACAPQPHEIVSQAARLRCPFLLVDTFEKSSGGLLQSLSPPELADLVRLTRQQKLGVVLAGSLSEETIPRVLPLEPDYVAVRGMVCRGGRSGPIEAARIERLLQLLEDHSIRSVSRIA
ncbi:MAG: hypothetical protein GXY83_37330 [Rhodopirellula sp.]|nr:hypothetical protein [Rhodopirellula sp.]